MGPGQAALWRVSFLSREEVFSGKQPFTAVMGATGIGQGLLSNLIVNRAFAKILSGAQYFIRPFGESKIQNFHSFTSDN